MSSDLPDYVETQSVLAPEGDAAHPAEAHGTLCGLLCAGAEDLPGAWIENTLADGGEEAGSAPGARAALARIYAATSEAIRGEDMAFRLLLPSDDEPLADRARALAAWCQGFLYGLAVRGLKPMDELPDELREVLTDLSEISRAAFTVEETEEEGEEAYAELVEYVRVAVQLFHDSCTAPAAAGERPPGTSLH